MANCLNVCDTSTPMPSIGYLNKPKKKYAKGGIGKIVLFDTCVDFDFPFVDVHPENPWLDLRNWKAALCQGALKVSGNLVGQKARASVTNVMVDSCLPEQAVSGSQQYTFREYGVSYDDTTCERDFKEYDFWNNVKENSSQYKFSAIGCDDVIRMYAGKFTADVSDVIPETYNDLSYFDGIIKLPTHENIKPILVEGLYELLTSFQEGVTDCTGYYGI